MLGNRHQSKGYYRFINNEKVNSADLIALFGSYSSHLMSDSSVILALQDTTELDYTGSRSASQVGCMEYAHRKGLYLHTQLLVDGRGLAQGILSQSFISRSEESLGKLSLGNMTSLRTKKATVGWKLLIFCKINLATKRTKLFIVFVIEKAI
jgi:hypothetical protein